MDEFLKIILSIFLLCSTAVTLICIYIFYKAVTGISKVKNRLKRVTVSEAIDASKAVKKTVIRITRMK